MDFEDEKMSEIEINEERELTLLENEEDSSHFNNIEQLKKTKKFNFKNNLNDYKPNDGKNNSIVLTFDGITLKNMRFIALVMKIFSVIGIIGGIFGLLAFFTGIILILVSIKFFKAANSLEEAILLQDEKKLKLYFNEQAKGFKYYIIFIIVITILFFILIMILGFSSLFTNFNSYDYYNSY